MVELPTFMPNKPRVSVVIPTKNRYGTLIPVVKSILTSIPDDELQIVIQDNTEDNAEALVFLAQLNDSRVVYSHDGAAMSIVENTEAALEKADGEYVTFIGDDDLVSPYIVDIARKVSAAGIEAVTYPPAYYWWPSVVFTRPSKFHQPGAFWFPYAINRDSRFLDPDKELTHVLNSGAVSIFNLPRLYHGLVRRDVLLRMRATTGRFVNGASPDMALAAALACHISKHILLDYPLTIYGASRNSGGGFTAENKHYGRLEDQPHLPRTTVDNWCEKLPRVWSEYTIYPQTVGEVLRALSVRRSINFTAFYAAMSVNEPHLRHLLGPLLIDHLREHPGRIPEFLKIMGRKIVGKLRRWFKTRVTGLPYRLEIFSSPAECVAYLRAMRPADFKIRAARDS